LNSSAQLVLHKSSLGAFPVLLEAVTEQGSGSRGKLQNPSGKTLQARSRKEALSRHKAQYR
jgi:hypothetical protein